MKNRILLLLVIILLFTASSNLFPQTVKDIDGNVYKTVKIGSQIWMAENLKTSKFNDGTPIPLITADRKWERLETPGYCWFNNDSNAVDNKFGALYNWYTVNSANLCPVGWHVPPDGEWQVLISYLGGEKISGGKLKETGTSHWKNPNITGANKIGFSALPGGERSPDGLFHSIGYDVWFWSSVEDESFSANSWHMENGTTDLGKVSSSKKFGFSVRCTQDDNKEFPVVTTDECSLITSCQVKTGGNVIDNGGLTGAIRGVCWSKFPKPTIDNNRINAGSGKGKYISIIKGIEANTTYYIRAYATNIIGTAYGNEVSFETLPATKPVLNTKPISSRKLNSAISGGNILSNGGDSITSRGICWNNSANPTVANFKTADGGGNGQFESDLSGITPDTKYYIRAYATNSAGTGYGKNIILRTYSGTIKDIDGNTYYFITLGTQTWMTKNLKTTKLNDGTIIPYVINDDAWNALSTPAYCWYNNDLAKNKASYGALYNWYTINTGKLCPEGWHVPSDVEWTMLINCLGGEHIAGGKLKEAGFNFWARPNERATNESGFTALPGGYRYSSGNYTFNSIEEGGYWWSDKNTGGILAWSLSLGYGHGGVNIDDEKKNSGLSVRCLRSDDPKSKKHKEEEIKAGNQITIQDVGLFEDPVIDIEGNVYQTVTVGTQTWMTEKLKTTHFSDGTPIPLVPSNKDWEMLKTPGYCWYKNDSATYKNAYGALYNFYTVKTKKLCPAGWHVPSDFDWLELVDFFGEDVSGISDKLFNSDTTFWKTINYKGTIEAGSGSSPGVKRNGNGQFEYNKEYSDLWGSLGFCLRTAWSRRMDSGYGADFYNSSNINKREGYNVRCVKD